MLQHSFFSYNTISCHCFIKTCFRLFNRYPFKVTQCYLVMYLSEIVFVQPELLEKNSPTVDGVMLTVTGFFNTFGLEVLPTFKQDSTLEA